MNTELLNFPIVSGILQFSAANNVRYHISIIYDGHALHFMAVFKLAMRVADQAILDPNHEWGLQVHSGFHILLM